MTLTARLAARSRRCRDPRYALEGGRRVVTCSGIQSALGTARSGGAQRAAAFLESIDREGLPRRELITRITSPIRPRAGNALASGYEATTLADICRTVLSAEDSGVLDRGNEGIVGQCQALALASTDAGIVALSGAEADGRPVGC